jgi:hypothetical protein
LGVFGRIFVELAKGGGETAELMIDATHLKAHRTAASLLKKGLFPGISDVPKAGRTRNCTLSATAKAARAACF